MPLVRPNADSLEAILQLVLYGRRTIQLATEGRLAHDCATVVRLAAAQALARPDTVEVVRRSCSMSKPVVTPEISWTTNVVDYADRQIRTCGLPTNR